MHKVRDLFGSQAGSQTAARSGKIVREFATRNANLTAFRKEPKMRNLRIGMLTAVSLVALTPAQAQMLATQRAGFNLPAAQIPAPSTPGGAVVIGKQPVHR